jgi:hypothetical protein
MLTAKKYLKQKNSEKNCIPGEVFSLHVLIQDFPYNDAFITSYRKSPKKSVSPSHMRPEPWKSCHPREKNWICHVTDPS